jgi:hypothetical protein
MGLGAPKAVATLDERQLEIVQFATAQLQVAGWWAAHWLREGSI